MAAKRFQVAAAGDSVLARDQFVNTLYFEVTSLSPDYDALCADLATIFQDHWYSGPARQIRVTAYDVGPAPNFPIGEHIQNVGVAPASNCPREVALCLSFYAERNVPRQRGRIYLPACAIGAAPDVRPSSTVMGIALALGQHFADLGGANVQWNVHSQTTGEDHAVTNCWVDDEWDTIRSRGLRATTRVTSAPGS